MIRNLGAFTILALRIALSAWFVLLAGGTVLGLIFDVALRGDMAYGLSTTFLAALIVFPPVALCWGLGCAWWQRRALAGIENAPGLLSVGCSASIQVELSDEQALRLAESAMRSVFVATRLQNNGLGVAARIAEIATSNALWPGLFEDNLRLTVAPLRDARSVLRIAIDPVHVWIYGVFAVDGGRCARRMRSFETALLDLIRAQGEIIDEDRRRQAMQAQRSEAQLAMLRAHVEPHFIFNTLAHVRASLGPGDGTAAAMLDALVEFLRRNTLALNGDETSLREELAMVESYLRIIGLRLGERLRYDLDCPPALLDRTVPAACLLVLVENAVKHGIERSADGGAIAVRCADEDGGLALAVRNDGPPFDVSGGRQGGLSNLQARLKLIYGATRPLEIEHPREGGVVVSLLLPAHGKTA
ncbi:sensor histidine kinase [Lysobacter hankyongensis]|uniref:Signal transduction histidine kinase internal region domain-containing protein n=1 Tax=Lysobacter hankyongensis TaxID=1176535 RepID=A0ABP9BX39_9GAMM